MVTPGLTINLFEFQEKAVLKLLDITSSSDSKQTVIMKAPTGSGKTIILIDYIDKYLSNINSKTAFIWLCPGKGNLEEQSKIKMQKLSPNRKTQNLNDALLSGFEEDTTTFINWELVTKKGNTSIRDSERKNLFERISDAHRKGLQFIIIIDEEHSNNTAKANNIINSFVAKNIIRVSATTIKNKRFEYFEINESDVINAGLITKALYVNEGIANNVSIDDDYDILLDLADEKRKSIHNRYQEINKDIRPLVLIQFPNGKPETIEAVEQKLEKMGYTYDNGMVAKWMSNDKKELTSDLTNNDGIPLFLLMKQAISTGWDCPRAKILVKLREGMNESFEVQTIGRIRRMPEAKHYEDDLLDFCYVYTFDEKYKAGLLSDVDKAYEPRRLFLKQKCKTFTLEKQVRDLDYKGLGEREVLAKIHEFFISKYNLNNNKKDNKLKLEANGYIFGDEVISHALQGKFIKTDSIMDDTTYITTRKKISTNKHGLNMLHSVDAIKTAISMQNRSVKTILERLFRKNSNHKHKLILLDTTEFYAFIINNQHKLKEEFKEITIGMSVQQSLTLHPKTITFKIPEQDFFKYDIGVKNEIDYISNAYEHYTSGYATSLVRSTSEMLFEQYCEIHKDIEWVYKNGDTGQQYFSIVYIDNLQNQRLFYVDYIIKKTDGSIWLIETKGGESHGQNKNIDNQTSNKFNALKNYAKNHNINWGFVRDKDNQLYINNTEYFEDMSNKNWKDLKDKF